MQVTMNGQVRSKIVAAIGLLCAPLTGCGERKAEVVSCDPEHLASPIFQLVDSTGMPPGSAVRQDAAGNRIAVSLKDFVIQKSPDAEPDTTILTLRLHVPVQCALAEITATLSGEATIAEDASARLLIDLDQNTLAYVWEKPGYDLFTTEVAAHYPPGFIEPESANEKPSRLTQDYSVPFSMQPGLYGPESADVKIRVSEIMFVARLEPVTPRTDR